MSETEMSISELHTKWRKEKSFYEVREVGTGVEIFVKDVLKSPDVFGLKVGLNSTRPENRKYEFLEKKTSKGSRQPDITIFITPEIIIPVEVERYGNINAGKGQLLQYQIDLEKKYGILTDGYMWRFYINNVYTEYTQETLFDRTDVFLEFWREYIKEEKYYLSFFEELGQLSLLQKIEELHVDENRQIFFEDITELIKSFKNKLNIEGYLKDVPTKERAKTAVEITYAYIIQFILYKTLVDNEFDEFPSEYKTLTEAIHGHLKENRFKDILGCIDRISAGISKNIYRPFSQEQNFIADRLLELYREPQNELHDVSPWLDIFVFIKKYNFAEVRNEIFGYIYENYLKALYEDEKKGQYYTDPAVVNFMLEQIGYTPENLKKSISTVENNISLVDPACGSGTFLYSAVDTLIRTIGPDSEQRAKKVEELVNKDIFGLDIAEFPLYLAEMNILMRMLPLIINEKYNNPVEKKIKVFKTKDSISEFMDTALRNTINDIDIASEKSRGQGYFDFTAELDLDYSSYMRDRDDLKEMKESLEQRPRCPRRRFDFVIGNPPYISYNECSKQNILIFKLMREGHAKLTDIYGVNLHSIPHKKKKYSPKPNLYTFFIALGLALLKDNCKLCYIIPQTVLVNNDFDVIRYHLAKFTTIEKIITFKQKMFIGRGLTQSRPVITSSLILVLSKKSPDPLHNVEIVNYKNHKDTIRDTLENISQEREITKYKIPQMQLVQNVSNWNFIKKNKLFINLYEYYQKNSENISIYYVHILAKDRFKSSFYFDGSVNIPKKDITYSGLKSTENYYAIPSLKSRGYVIKTRGWYPKNKKIKIAEGSQGLVIAQPRYKVLWKYINHDKFYFVEGKDILPIYQQYSIASDNKEEVYYLFSLLNSKVVSLLLDSLLKVEQEDKLSFLLGLTSIKEFVRVPKITQNNQIVKNEIIKRTEEMLALEEVKLADLVDFSNVIMQKFDAVLVKRNSLVLCKDKKETKLDIKTNKALVEKTIADKYSSEELGFEGKRITLSELKSLPVIDFERQAELKDYIDDLVFALYFNIPLTKVGLKYHSEIKKVCQKNRFYKLVNVSS